MMKLSKAQQNVIDKMLDGWELGWSHSWGRSCWLQKGHIGEGGKSEDVKCSTAEALFKRGLIKQRNRVASVMIFELAP